MRSILDKVGLIPVPYAAGACLIIVAIMAGCTSDSYGGDCHANGALQFNGGCHVRQNFSAAVVAAPVYVQPFAVQQVVAHPQVFRQRVVVQQVQQHHVQQQAVVVQKLQVQRPQRQVVRQRIVTRSR